MKTLANNSELYTYLVELFGKLESCGAESLSATVLAASRQSASSSTEFLGESRLALMKVYQSSEMFLTNADRVEIQEVLQQISTALDRR